MGWIPSVEEARNSLWDYNTEPFHRQHGEIVGAVLGVFAAEYAPGQEAYWQAVGLLHDLDFEKWPEEHCKKVRVLMEEKDVDEAFIHAVVSHGYGLCSEEEPTLMMEKILFAVDELTGLIGAAALMRPSKSVSDMEVRSLKKKFKDKKFAAGCSREVITQGAERLGWTLDELLEKTLDVMKQLSPTMGL